MHSSNVSKTGFGIAIAIIGVFIAWRTLDRTLFFTAPSESNNSGAPLPSTPGYTSAVDVDFDAFPNAKNVVEIVKRVAARSRALAEQMDAASLRVSQLAALEDRIARHLQIILTGSYDQWLAQLSELRNRMGVGPLEEEDWPPPRKQWEKQAKTFRMAPLSVEQMTIRSLYLDGQELKHERTPFFVNSNPDRSPYRIEVDTRDRVIEALIPMRMDVSGDEEDRPVTCGLAYQWSDKILDWIPFRIAIYSDVGGKFRFPVF